MIDYFLQILPNYNHKINLFGIYIFLVKPDSNEHICQKPKVA